MGQSKISADLKQNRLLLTLIGVITKEAASEIYTEIRFCVADLKPGFSVVNDLTQCRLGYLAGLGTFGKIREYLISKQVGPIVRIVRKNQIAFKQISRIIDRNERYQPVYVNSMEEAEEKLAVLNGSQAVA